MYGCTRMICTLHVPTRPNDILNVATLVKWSITISLAVTRQAYLYERWSFTCCAQLICGTIYLFPFILLTVLGHIARLTCLQHACSWMPSRDCGIFCFQHIYYKSAVYLVYSLTLLNLIQPDRPTCLTHFVNLEMKFSCFFCFSFYRGSHGVIVVFDVSRIESFANVKRWLAEIDSNCDATVQKVLGLCSLHSSHSQAGPKFRQQGWQQNQLPITMSN